MLWLRIGSRRSSFAAQLIATGGATARTGEGVRTGGFVLQRPGPALTPAPDGRVLTYPTTFAPGTASVGDATVITLGSGEERAGVDFPLRALPTVRVSGVLTGPAGPIANLALRLVPPNGADLQDSNPTGVAMSLTDDAGGVYLRGDCARDLPAQGDSPFLGPADTECAAAAVGVADADGWRQRRHRSGHPAEAGHSHQRSH